MTALNPTGASPASLQGLRALVVEDHFLLAADIADALEDAGAVVVGPAPNLDQGLALATAERLDAAILDIDLGGAFSYPVAETLRHRGIPFVFATAFTADQLPEEFRAAPRIEKPFSPRQLIAAVRAILP